MSKYETGPTRELAACFIVAVGDECWEISASVYHYMVVTTTSNEDRLVGNTYGHIVREDLILNVLWIQPIQLLAKQDVV